MSRAEVEKPWSSLEKRSAHSPRPQCQTAAKPKCQLPGGSECWPLCVHLPKERKLHGQGQVDPTPDKSFLFIFNVY